MRSKCSALSPWTTMAGTVALAALFAGLFGDAALAKSVQGRSEPPRKEGPKADGGATTAPQLTLKQLVFARRLEGRSPADVGDHIAADGERVYAHAQLANSGDPQDVTMAWSRDGKERHRFTVVVGRSPRWRTWSYLKASPYARGTWTVTLRSGDAELGRAELVIGEQPTAKK